LGADGADIALRRTWMQNSANLHIFSPISMARNIFDAIVGGLICLDNTRRCPLEICKNFAASAAAHMATPSSSSNDSCPSRISVNLRIVQGTAAIGRFRFQRCRNPLIYKNEDAGSNESQALLSGCFGCDIKRRISCLSHVLRFRGQSIESDGAPWPSVQAG
jgi:hypothetical protein